MFLRPRLAAFLNATGASPAAKHWPEEHLSQETHSQFADGEGGQCGIFLGCQGRFLKGQPTSHLTIGWGQSQKAHCFDMFGGWAIAMVIPEVDPIFSNMAVFLAIFRIGLH